MRITADGIRFSCYARDDANYVVQVEDLAIGMPNAGWRTEYLVRRPGHGGLVASEAEAITDVARTVGGRDMVYAVRDALAALPRTAGRDQ